MKECEVVEDLKGYSYGEGALPGFGEGDSCSAGQEWADALASEAQGVVDGGKEPSGERVPRERAASCSSTASRMSLSFCWSGYIVIRRYCRRCAFYKDTT